MCTFFLSVMFFFLTCMPCDAQPESRGLKTLRSQANRRIAICIGINHYADPKLNTLKKASNDAYGLASVLEQKGDFKTFIFSDIDRDGQGKPISARMLPTKRQLEEFLTNTAMFGDIKPDDLVVFSFSGHGISDAEHNGYILPLDWNEAEPYESAIPVSAITNWLEKLGVTKSLVILDACREEMSTSRSLDTIPRLYDEKFLSANVSAVFYATRQGGFSYEDPDSQYGAFTRFLVDGLNGAANRDSDEVVTFRELATFVEDGLSDWALKNGFSQRPYTRIFGEQSGDLALTYPSDVKPQNKISAFSLKSENHESNITEIKMISIPGGEFQMGSNSGGNNEKPSHKVILSSFEMSSTEITIAQYNSIMGKKPSNSTMPIVYISWEEANAFCSTLSKKMGKEYFLPTEAQWEYACRAGTTTEYYTGDKEWDLDSAGWYYMNSGDSNTYINGILKAIRSRPHPVAQKKPNAFGLYDMHGNVWEWCSDWYGSYSPEIQTDPKGPQTGTFRVIRGGSWSDGASDCRSAYRSVSNPTHSNNSIGFRVVGRP